MRRRELCKAMMAIAAGTGTTGRTRFAPAAARQAGADVADGRYLPGDIRRYKRARDPDYTRAMQRALDRGGSVFVPRGTYEISATVRLKAQGQTVCGEGPGISVLRYLGPPGGRVLSVSDGAVNHSDCAISDLTVDGGGHASVGIEGYDDSVRGGSWRTRIERVAIVGVSHGADATAIELGTGPWPNFAHDTRIDGCYLRGSARGVWGAGGKYALSQCSLFQLSEAACMAPPGSAWTLSQCIFSQNGWDFDGANIQQADFSGCWFEDSRRGIYRSTIAHSVSFIGCYFHTDNPACMMDFGAAAGYHFIGGHYVPRGTRSLRIVNVNAAATGAVIGQPIPLEYAGGGAEVPQIIMPGHARTGDVRSLAAALAPNERVVLRLGTGVFFVGVDARHPTKPGIRSQASYCAFLSDADDEALDLIAQHHGRLGKMPFTLEPSGGSLTLTNTGTQAARVALCGSGRAD